MKNANVVLVEDDFELQQIIRGYIERSGHIVTRQALNLGEALSAVDDIDKGELDCDVVCVDGSLGTGFGPEDGRDVVDDIRKRHLGIKVVSFSTYLMRSDYNIDVDVEVQKPNIRGVIDAINDF